MAENMILNIIIKVLDEATLPLKKIEQSVSNINNNIRKLNIKDTLFKGLNKANMKGFNLDSFVDGDLITKQAKITSQKIRDALMSSLTKKGGFDFNKKLQDEIKQIDYKNKIKEIQNSFKFKGGKSGLNEWLGIDDITPKLKKVNKEMLRFNMNSLTFLFTGMALKKVFGGMLNSLYQTFNLAKEDTSEFINSTKRLNAAWTFLKFTIFNALDNPLFVAVIDYIVDMVNWIAQFFSTNPFASKLFVGLIALGALIGSTAMAGSIIFQVDYMTKLMLSFFGTKIDTGSSGIFIALKSLKTLVLTHPILAFFAAIAVIMGSSMATYDTYKEKAKTTFDSLKKGSELAVQSLLNLIGVNIDAEDSFKFLGATGVWIVALLADMFLVLTKLIVNGLALIKIGIKSIMLYIGELISKKIKEAITLINLLNLIPGMHIDTSGLKDFQTTLDESNIKLGESLQNNISELEEYNSNIDELVGTNGSLTKILAKSPTEIFKDQLNSEKIKNPLEKSLDFGKDYSYFNLINNGLQQSIDTQTQSQQKNTDVLVYQNEELSRNNELRRENNAEMENTLNIIQQFRNLGDNPSSSDLDSFFENLGMVNPTRRATPSDRGH